MTGLATFTRCLDQTAQDDFWSSFDQETDSLPHHVSRALSRAAHGAIIPTQAAQLWLTQRFGVNLGRDHNKQEIGAVIIDYDWIAYAWRVIGGAA